MAEQPDPLERHREVVLVRLLLIVTFVTGAVDAISILELGRVFVANMTGNVVFLGFALGGAKGFSLGDSLLALAAFLAGAGAAARILTSRGVRLLAEIAATEAALATAATIVAVAASGTAARYAVTAFLAAAMGGQNAIVRRLAVADLTTTVLTMTLTGLAADRAGIGSTDSHTARRLGAVAALLGGAIAGALLVLHTSTGWALGAVAVVLIGVAGTAWAERDPRPLPD